MNTKAILIAAAATVAPWGLALAQTGITWNPATYDPQPDNDKDSGELTLPMPCGGAMVFRKVEVQNNDGQEDRHFLIGTDDKITGINERRDVHLAGPFGPDKSKYVAGPVNYYYLAKYELSEAQYDAIVAGQDKDHTCPSGESLMPMGNAPKPKGELSQLEARRVAALYTDWLKTSRPTTLPYVGSERDISSASAIVRLPTEPEWEFAARGGMVFVSAKFNLALPDIGKDRLDSLDRFHSTEGDSSSARPIGFGKANALGLFNMLGNVAELTDDAFSPVLERRLVGLTGNPLVKGGSFLTHTQNISLGMRNEMSTHDRGGNPVAARSIGARFVLSAPVEYSIPRIQDTARRKRNTSVTISDPREMWGVLIGLIEGLPGRLGIKDGSSEKRQIETINEIAAGLRNYAEDNGPMNLEYLVISLAAQIDVVKYSGFNIMWVQLVSDCPSGGDASKAIKCLPSGKKEKYLKKMKEREKSLKKNINDTAGDIMYRYSVESINVAVRAILTDPENEYLRESICSSGFLTESIRSQLTACEGGQN